MSWDTGYLEQEMMTSLPDYYLRALRSPHWGQNSMQINVNSISVTVITDVVILTIITLSTDHVHLCDNTYDIKCCKIMGFLLFSHICYTKVSSKMCFFSITLMCWIKRFTWQDTGLSFDNDLPWKLKRDNLLNISSSFKF